jgi:hypothetical protein
MPHNVALLVGWGWMQPPLKKTIDLITKVESDHESMEIGTISSNLVKKS